METLNGLGVTLYGKKDINKSDASYTATKWFVIAFLPIIPLGSYRVKRGENSFGIPEGKLLPGTSTDFYMEKIKLDWLQIIKTYLIGWFIGILFLSICWWISCKLNNY